ncbi:MAG: cupin domain-containing protein [Bryobacteraceae bacterium]|nr:cupin domain-containing protein [Bryobacteraceae bacterium]
MHHQGTSFATDTNQIPEIDFAIPGATPGGVTAQLLNFDSRRGLVTTVIHIHPGARIPAHYHNEGAEAHYVLEGDFINDGVTHGPGGFLTHPVGAVHGPHESKTGCKILTVQTAFVDPQNPDFHLAEGVAS